MINLRSIKTQLIIYLVAFALFLVLKEKDRSFLIAFSICVATAVVVEALILYVKTRKWQITESAIIAGAIMGFVISSDEIWWKLIAASTLAIVLKHVIRFHHKHIFNPAALGIFLSAVVLGVSSDWRGTYLWYWVVPFGVYLAYKIRKVEILLGYAGVSLLLFGVQAFLQKVPLLNIFGYFSYFYIFIMVIEPKTTPSGLGPKYAFGALLAALGFILTSSGLRVDVEIFSLLVMNAGVLLLNKLFIKRGVGL